jgi:dTDP-4-dehydrorhamnose reductase
VNSAGIQTRILLTGASGQVGHELRHMLPAYGEVVATTRSELDLGDERAIRRTLQQMRPGLIVNAAAYTAVDRAEQEPDAARIINVTAPRVLAVEAARLQSPLIHFSTDYVFDGRSSTPYRPDDEPNPLNVYGMTKLEGERAVAAVGGDFLIVRAGWIYATRGRNFLLTVLNRAESGQPLRVVDDQRGCPNWARLIAEGVCSMIGAMLLAKQSGKEAIRGIYHLSCQGVTTWYGFAQAILELASPGSSAMLSPISSEEYGAPAERPQFSLLNCDTTRESFGVELGDWRDGLRQAWMNRSAADLKAPTP